MLQGSHHHCVQHEIQLHTYLSTTEGAPHNASSSGKVAGAVVGTLLGVALLGTVVAVALIVLWRRGHLGALLSNIIPCRKTSGSLAPSCFGFTNFMHTFIA